MAGIIMLPMEETSATAEPVTPPKNIEATQTICARLPGSQPTSTSAISTRRRAMPPRAISVPANTKKITASSGNVLIAVSMRWTIVALSTPGSSKVANTVDTPTANEIGMPTAVRMIKARPRRRRTMALVHTCTGDGGGFRPHDLVDDQLEGEHHDQEPADRHRRVVPIVRVGNRLHQIVAEILHKGDPVAENDPAESEDHRAQRDAKDATYRLRQRVEQDVEADMVAVEDSDRRGQKGYPDQQIARDFFGPRHRLPKAVTGDNRTDYDDEQRACKDDADPAHHGHEQAREPVKQIEKLHGFPPRRKGRRITAALSNA